MITINTKDSYFRISNDSIIGVVQRITSLDIFTTSKTIILHDYKSPLRKYTNTQLKCLITDSLQSGNDLNIYEDHLEIEVR